MRILGTILLGTGLLVSGQGCTVFQHTAGICDCDPPPVGSLLIAPSPAHASVGVYGSVDHTPIHTPGIDHGIPSKVVPLPIQGISPNAVPIPSGASRPESVPVMPKVITPSN